MTQTVTLSYLARGFDWAADYTASLSADGTRLDLGAWVTLANSNSVGFPSAHTQVVAGRVNREQDDGEPAMNAGLPIYASCWPQGTTSDQPAPAVYELYREERMFKKSVAALPVAAPAPMAMREVALSAGYVQQEQLGDLKLYRVPERTTLASRQAKQVRLMDRSAIPINTIYGADFATGYPDMIESGTSFASHQEQRRRIIWGCRCPRVRWLCSRRMPAIGCCNTNPACATSPLTKSSRSIWVKVSMFRCR